jgi:putative tryptophan/tyrosine transport system substrate-binding protein
MRRREVIGLVGALLARASGAMAQGGDRMRRLAVLIPFAASDPEARGWVAAFAGALRGRGWSEGTSLRIDHRWTGADAERMRDAAAEAVALAPEAILAHGVPMLAALGRTGTKLPVVFVQVADPVVTGFVESLARPGRNVTGFTNFEYATGAKWLELLKEVEPRLARVLVIQNPENPSWSGHFAAIAESARLLGVELTPAAAHDRTDFERVVADFARAGGGGLIALPSPIASAHRELLVGLAAQQRLPAVYPFRSFVTRGGLMSYRTDTVDLYRRAAEYVDRVLRGEKPGGLPVQQPTKFELVLNLNTAKALGLTIPPTLIARADEVID